MAAPELPREEESSASERLLEALVLHQILLSRMAGGVAQEATQELNRSEARVGDAIRRRLGNARGIRRPSDLRRYDALLSVIKTARDEAFDGVRDRLLSDMEELARYESGFLSGLAEKLSGENLLAPDRAIVRSIVRSRPFEGRVLRRWVENLRQEDLRRIGAAIRLGMAAGENSDAIARRVVGTMRLRGRDGITQISRRNLESIVRTAVTHVDAEIDAELIQMNPSVFDRERFTAVLDTRTTPICRSLDGEVFPVGRGPRPPLHFNCRSRRVGIFVGDEVPAVPSYEQWLRNQPAALQVDILGRTRAKLFRQGRLSLDRFVNRNGDQIPLRDLATREREAFRVAGIEL